MTKKLQNLLNSKSETITNLFKLGVYCTLSKEKHGLKGWNSVIDQEQNLKRILRLLEQNSNYNIAINLQSSKLICIDIDDPEAFEKFFNLNLGSETFNTVSCKTPGEGYHFYVKNDLGLAQNYRLTLELAQSKGYILKENEKSSDNFLEIHSVKHLSNFIGEGYEVNKKYQEIKNASEFEGFFEQVEVLANQNNTQSNNSNFNLETGTINPLHTEAFIKEKEEYLHTEAIKEGNFAKREFFKKLGFGKLERRKDFIDFAFKVAFNTEPRKQMLCVLHSEHRPSASVFQNKKSGLFLYKDFHDNGCYSILNLLLEYYRIPKKEWGIYRVAFAYFLVSLFVGQEKKEFEILQALKQFKNAHLQRAFFLVASLSKLTEFDTQEHFLSVRILSQALSLNDITRANRILNFLCLIDVFRKNYRGSDRACSYKLNKDLNIETLISEAVKLSEIDVFRLSKEKALELFDYDKVNSIYKRSENRFEYKGILNSIFLCEVYSKGLSFALGN